MFYLNSNDPTIVPDSLFFLQKIGLLKHRQTNRLGPEALYFLENGIPRKLYTPETVKSDSTKSKTILVFDCFLGVDPASMHGHNLMIVPHVYFDYVTSIKELITLNGLNSFKIFAPEGNSTLIPKKHLKVTLPFLKDSDFISQTEKMKSQQTEQKVKLPISRISILWMKSMLSSFLLFVFRPFVQTKLFFAKYNMRYLTGQLRVGLIKSFYFVYNLRFDFNRVFFRIKQWRFFFHTYNFPFFWGKFRLAMIGSYFLLEKNFRRIIILLRYKPIALWGNVRLLFIRGFYAVINLRFFLPKIYNFFVNLRFPIVHALHAMHILFRYRSVTWLGNMKILAIRFYFQIINLRFPIVHALHAMHILFRYRSVTWLGNMKILAIRLYFRIINLRFVLPRIYNFFVNLRFPIVRALHAMHIFFRYRSVTWLGNMKLLAIRFYFRIINLRFVIYHLISTIFNFFRYTPIYVLGLIRTGFIRLFYFVYNLRFPLKHFLVWFYWFNFKYTFYPLRKIIWFTEYQFQKRILKTSDVSKH